MIEIPLINKPSDGEDFPVNLFLKPDAFDGRPGLVGTPGLLEVAEVWRGPVRGMLATKYGQAEYLYVVSHDQVYRLDSNFNETHLAGTLDTNTGRVSMAEGALGKILLVDGRDAWSIDETTLALAGIPTDVNLPINAGYVDTYFFLTDEDTGKWYISASNDVSSWGALDFASKETTPDDIVQIVESRNDLYLFGEKKTEIWANAGYPDFPFAQSGGGTIDKGLAVAATACLLDGTIFFLADDLTVRRLDGYTPAIVSTHGLASIIKRMATISDAFAFGYYDRGDSFYAISFPTENKTFAFNAATGKWHRWAGWNNHSEFVRHRGNCHAYFAGKNLVGDYENGKIYEISGTTYADDGETLKRKAVSQTISNSRDRFNVSEVEVEFKSGVGLSTGQGSEPKCMVRFSRDKGRNWSNERTGNIGASGSNLSRAIFRRCGGGYRDFTVEISVSDPVEVCILGLWGRM